MLILHPESQCDICLEHYTCNSSGQSPHVIPCGHIFCKTCLRTFRPPNCPLCRQYFFADQIKRLHVDRLEPDKVKQIDFLNQLILGWCEMNDQQFEVLLSPVQNWLAPRNIHECEVLRKAVIILNKYQLLKARQLSERNAMERLVNRVKEDALERTKRKENWKALESQLRQEIRELKTTVRMRDGAISQLTKLVADCYGSTEDSILAGKVTKCEMTPRQLKLLVKKQEETIGSLRRELEYYMNLSSFLRSSPLPRPPKPVPFERQPRFSQTLIYQNRCIPMMTAHENNENPNTNSYLSPPTRISKKNKGKERELGPSYDLLSITSSISTATTTSDSTTTPIVARPLSTSQNRTSSIISPEQVLRSVSPHCDVVPTFTSKPVVPDALIKYDPKLVSEARPDQLVPPRPPNPLISLYHGSMGRQGQTVSDSPRLRLMREPAIALVGPTRAGYHLAEYTPGEAARVITDLPQGNASTSAVAYANSDMNERCYRERETEGQKGLDNMNLVNNALPKIVGAAPIAWSRQGGNSQVYNNHVANGDSVLQVPSSSKPVDHQNFQIAPLHYSSFASQSQSQRTQVAGDQTETETSTTRFLGLTEDGMSTRQVPQSYHISGSGFSSGLYGTANPDETTTSSRTRPSHQTSLPGQSVQPIPVPVSTVPNAMAVVTTTEASSARGTATHLTSDNDSVRTTSSPSMPLLDWQGTGSSLDLNLRGFACGAGTTMMRPTDVDLENWRPCLPEGMAVRHHSTGNLTASVNRIEANDGNGFPILRESDEERTPLSRSLGTLVLNPGAINRDGTRPESDVASPQVSSRRRDGGHWDKEECSVGDRDRNIRTTRSQGGTERREGWNSIYAPMASMMEWATELSPGSSQVQSLYLKLQQLWHENNPQALSSSSYTQPTFSISPLSLPQTQSQSHTTNQPQPQVYSQSQSCRLNHRLSISTALQTAEPQHANPQSAVHNTFHTLSDWSEVGCHAEDGLSPSHSHLQLDTYPSNQFNNGGSQSLLTSPTLFDSNSNTNALGLDGLNEPQPLHITAPTPIVSSTKSFSQ